jgi:hypothetical protein
LQTVWSSVGLFKVFADAGSLAALSFQRGIAAVVEPFCRSTHSCVVACAFNDHGTKRRGVWVASPSSTFRRDVLALEVFRFVPAQRKVDSFFCQSLVVFRSTLP